MGCARPVLLADQSSGHCPHIIGNMWQLRRRDGPVNPRRVEVADPLLMSARIKEKARELGADLVGIARLTDDALYAGAEVPYRYAVCLGLRMDREEMRFVPQARAAVEVLRVYRAISRIAIELGEHVRDMGWPARAYGNPNSTDLLRHPTGRECRSRPTREAWVPDHEGARFERPARHCRHRSPARNRRACRHRRRDLASPAGAACSIVRRMRSPMRSNSCGARRSGTSTSTSAFRTSRRPRDARSASRSVRGASPDGARSSRTSSWGHEPTRRKFRDLPSGLASPLFSATIYW